MFSLLLLFYPEKMAVALIGVRAVLLCFALRQGQVNSRKGDHQRRPPPGSSHVPKQPAAPFTGCVETKSPSVLVV